MTDQQSISSESLQAKTDSLGSLLREARLKRNATQQDVSNSLRYSVKQIDALENNALEALPDAMMTRGFIRSYAKYLEIDAEPLLASYRATLGDDPQKVISVKSSMRPVALTKETLPWLNYTLATIVVLLFLLAWIAYVEYMPQQPLQTSPDAGVSLQDTEKVVSAAVPNPEPMPEVALPAAERATEAEANVDLNGMDIAQTEANAVANVNQNANPAAQVVATPTTPVASATINAQQQNTAVKNITFSFSGQSWVSVTDKTGKVVYEKLSHAGEHETIQATPPLNVVIGNASDTKLNFSGQDLDLATNTKNNVARITLE